MKKDPPFLSKDLIGKNIIGIIVLDGVAELMLFEDGNALVLENDQTNDREGVPFPYWATWK